MQSQCLLPPLQRGYIDGPVLNTFHTNLVVLPAVMEYMQYGMIALGLATIIIAAFVRYRVKVRLPPPPAYRLVGFYCI